MFPGCGRLWLLLLFPGRLFVLPCPGRWLFPPPLFPGRLPPLPGRFAGCDDDGRFPPPLLLDGRLGAAAPEEVFCPPLPRVCASATGAATIANANRKAVTVWTNFFIVLSSLWFVIVFRWYNNGKGLTGLAFSSFLVPLRNPTP